MIRILRCCELMPGCDFVARARTVESLLDVFEAHVARVHGVGLTPDLRRRMEQAIRLEQLSSVT